MMSDNGDDCTVSSAATSRTSKSVTEKSVTFAQSGVSLSLFDNQ